jgi:hypothetical protein
MLTDQTITSAQEQCLRDQTITADSPGTILRDFQMLLDFLRPEGVEAGGKYNLLPIKLISELDDRLSRPLHLKLKRPQIRSHPYLQGLNLLLRATGLCRVEGTSSKARVVLDPQMLMQWDQLNHTERYFNLLEAWLRVGRAEMVGEQWRMREQFYLPCLQAWQSVVAGSGRRLEIKEPEFVSIEGIYRRFYLLALMELFGLVEVKQPPSTVTSWVPAGVNRVPFGDAVFSLLYSRIGFGLRDGVLNIEEDDQFDQGEEEEGDEGADEEEFQDESAEELSQFGVWQPLFQPYFAEWQQNLQFPELEPREGTFVFRVSLGDTWRRIAMPADDTLDDLVNLILRSVNFDDEHLYAFSYRGRMGSTASINHPAMDEGPWADQIRIGALPLQPGQSMELEYDFGDNWEFDVKLERIEPPSGKVKPARILERHGKSPQQYPAWD